MSVLICPVCNEKIEKNGSGMVCPKRHSFDFAKSGYVNLLLSKQLGKTVHGDNKLMVRARREFLEKGYYSPLKYQLCNKIEQHFKGGTILDAGCGEGYYTTAIFDRLRTANIASKIYGIDISKAAVELASKRGTEIFYAAASVFHIPFSSNSCDLLVTMFAPYCGKEYLRVLKKGGIMVMAIPSENHLWELKKAIYDTPYKNQVKPYELDGFTLIDKERITYDMEIASQEDVQSLFSMTPYFYRTSPRQKERLEAIGSICTKADFELLIYRKI